MNVLFLYRASRENFQKFLLLFLPQAEFTEVFDRENAFAKELQRSNSEMDENNNYNRGS